MPLTTKLLRTAKLPFHRTNSAPKFCPPSDPALTLLIIGLSPLLPPTIESMFQINFPTQVFAVELKTNEKFHPKRLSAGDISKQFGRKVHLE